MGFSEKSKAKRTLAKNFAEPEDYKILQIKDKISEEFFIAQVGENKIKLETRGRKQKQILMKVDTFKAFCLIAKTKKRQKNKKLFY